MNQQLYYENKEADGFAKDIVFSTDAAITPTHPAYFSGGACYISSKKELFSNYDIEITDIIDSDENKYGNSRSY